MTPEGHIDRKSLGIAVSCYVIWGVLPAYWQLLSGVDSLLILCLRIVFSFVFTFALLKISGRTSLLREILLDKPAMRRLVPAAVLVTFNWGLYIWAVNSGHVIESSLGYYINPLIVFLFSVILFRENCSRLQFVAIALAFVGVLISVIAYGVFPFISFGLALSFAAYGVLKKKAHVDPVAGIAAETLVLSPFMLAFALIFRMDGILTLDTAAVLLLVFSGVVTATPLILYSRSVNHVPFFVVGFIQYLAPSLMLIYGLLSGEKLSSAQSISFAFIGLALVIFSIALYKNNIEARKELSNGHKD